MHLKRYLCTLCILMQSAVYASQTGLYWSPHIARGALYDHDEQLSPLISIEHYRFHYQLSEKVGATLTSSYFPAYKRHSVSTHNSWGLDLVGRYSHPALRKILFSRPLQVYGQLGGWYAQVADKRNTGDGEIKYRSFKGSGCALGVGASYKVFSRVSFNVSWKQLIALPLLKQDSNVTPITHSQRLSVGLEIRPFQ